MKLLISYFEKALLYPLWGVFFYPGKCYAICMTPSQIPPIGQATYKVSLPALSTLRSLPTNQLILLAEEVDALERWRGATECDLNDIDLLAPVPQVQVALQFDPFPCDWQLLGETGEVRVKESELEIQAVLEKSGRTTVVTIAKTINKNLRNTCKRLLNLSVTGKVRKEETAEKT
jgi:hypothetical protein